VQRRIVSDRYASLSILVFTAWEIRCSHGQLLMSNVSYRHFWPFITLLLLTTIRNNEKRTVCLAVFHPSSSTRSPRIRSKISRVTFWNASMLISLDLGLTLACHVWPSVVRRRLLVCNTVSNKPSHLSFKRRGAVVHVYKAQCWNWPKFKTGGQLSKCLKFCPEIEI